MTGENELAQDIMMHYHNIHGKNVRIHKRVTFLAHKRVVEYRSDRAQKRFLPFLPLKYTETREYMKIPKSITTEDQLFAYVAANRSSWLDHHSRRNRHRPTKENG